MCKLLNYAINENIKDMFGTNWDGTLQEQLLYNLNDSCFELLKDNEEFIKLKNRLKESNLKKQF